MIAFNESFVIQYWQNSTYHWDDWNVNDATYGEPPNYFTTKGDGNGLRYGGQTNDDDRGYVNLWGGFVQKYRGFMRRSDPGFPYTVNYPGIGMDKDYNWDDNMRCNALPLYPEKIDCDDSAGPPQYDFEIAQFRIF